VIGGHCCGAGTVVNGPGQVIRELEKPVVQRGDGDGQVVAPVDPWIGVLEDGCRGVPGNFSPGVVEDGFRAGFGDGVRGDAVLRWGAVLEAFHELTGQRVERASSPPAKEREKIGLVHCQSGVRSAAVAVLPLGVRGSAAEFPRGGQEPLDNQNRQRVCARGRGQ
jgi:hypothetical protein